LASVIAKARRDEYYSSLNLNFSDYSYRVLDSIDLDYLATLPVRERWIKSYFKRKGLTERLKYFESLSINYKDRQIKIERSFNAKRS